MYPYRGGIAHFQETMYRGLKRRGHEVDAVTFTRQYPESLFPGKTQLETGEVEDPAPAQRIIDTLNPRSWISAHRYITRLGPNAILFQYWMPFFAPAFGTIARRARKRRIRVLAVVHNAIPHERRPGDLALGRYFLRAIDGCIVMSDAVKQDLEKLGVRAEIRRVQHPVYDHFGDPMDRLLARRSLDLPEAAPTLLFFGFVRKYKGLHVLLRSMPLVLAAIPEARLIVAGEFYDDREPYLELIRDHGLEEAVVLRDDYIPDAEVARYFSAADIVVQPYISATQSGVAQIAFNFDKPLIVTDVGGLAETVPHEKAGLIVPPEDPEKLAGAIIRFFRDEMAESLKTGVREEKPKYSWDRLYEAVEDLTAGGRGLEP